MPAIVDRSPVVVAVGTSGDAPVLARRLRERIEALLPQRLGALAKLAGKLRRDECKARSTVRRGAAVLGAHLRRRRRCAMCSRAVKRCGGRAATLERVVDSSAHIARDAPSDVGEVCLIGAGPGDPDLLTLRALQLLQKADVILYDRLVSAEVLDRARRDAERIFVGKEAGGARVTQDEINALLVQLAQAGKRVRGSRAAILSSSAAAARSSKRSRRPASAAKSCRASPLRWAAPRPPAFRSRIAASRSA